MDKVNTTDFRLILSHTVGVDSAGHKIGDIQSPRHEKKILDTQQIIKDVINMIDDKTTVIVFGDHGMDKNGIHGGASKQEMSTVMFAY